MILAEREPFEVRFVPPPPLAPPLEPVKRCSELSPVLSAVTEEEDKGFWSEAVVDVSVGGIRGDVLVLRSSVCRTLLFKAGQPLQLEVPPVPSQRPSPGHVPPPVTGS